MTKINKYDPDVSYYGDNPESDWFVITTVPKQENWRDTEKMANDIKRSYMINKEKADKWDRLNSAFSSPVKWENIEYLAVAEADKKTPHIAYFDIQSERLKVENEQLRNLLEEKRWKEEGKTL